MKSLIEHAKLMGLKRTATDLAVCLLADVVRLGLHVAGQHDKAAELLELERRLWR